MRRINAAFKPCGFKQQDQELGAHPPPGGAFTQHDCPPLSDVTRVGKDVRKKSMAEKKA